MSKILVPIDFSENSILALKTAIVIANKIKTDLRMVHIEPTGGHYASGLGGDTNVDEHAQDKLETLIKEYGQSYAVNGRFDYYIGKGNVAEELINKVKYDNDVILVVTGSHGVSGISKSWIGGNAYKLICNTTRPVLVIREGMTYNEDFKNIAIPINISKSSRRKMPQAAGMVKLFNAQTTIIGTQTSSMLSIYYRIKTAVKQVVDYLNDNGITVASTVMLKGKDCMGKLFETVAVQKADMMIVEAENTGAFFADRFRPELTSIINNSPCPVLVVPVEYK